MKEKDEYPAAYSQANEPTFAEQHGELRRLREVRGLGIRAMAAEIGISTATLQRAETGEMVSVEVAGKLVPYLGHCLCCGQLVGPTPENRPAWMPDLDGKYHCDGCGTVLHHNGHCDCTWNRRLVPIDGGAVPPANSREPERKFKLGDRVRKIKGSSWQGPVVGFYSGSLTPVGYAVESERETGNVQIYPEAALEAVPPKTRLCGEV